jgi:hypothetical protein
MRNPGIQEGKRSGTTLSWFPGFLIRTSFPFALSRFRGLKQSVARLLGQPSGYARYPCSDQGVAAAMTVSAGVSRADPCCGAS